MSETQLKRQETPDAQQASFIRWVNHHLEPVFLEVKDLHTDFQDGIKLITLLEILSNKKMRKFRFLFILRNQMAPKSKDPLSMA
jgi:hypothetical protein